MQVGQPAPTGAASGKRNRVSGTINAASGKRNRVSGTINAASGKRNRVSGTTNAASGKRNRVSGTIAQRWAWSPSLTRLGFPETTNDDTPAGTPRDWAFPKRRPAKNHGEACAG
ncbi:MAG: hypothetical protein ACKOC8_07130 [Pirellulales bacterium]